MAEKRMISKSISVSETVNMLPDLFDMLLFTWMIPHTDDFGRLTGSPAKIKALVVPMLSKTIHDVAQSLQRLNDGKLIRWYEVDGERYIEMITFDKHQSGLHKRTKSKIPEFPGDSGNFREVPENSPRTELNLTELNRTEEKGTEQEEKGTELPPSPPIIPSPHNRHSEVNCFGLFEREIGDLTQTSSEKLIDLEEFYSETWLKKAIENAVYAGVKKLTYIEGTLKKWKLKNHPEPWTLEKEEPPSNVTPINRNKSAKPTIPMVQANTSEKVSEEEFQRMLDKAQQLDDMFNSSKPNQR